MISTASKSLSVAARNIPEAAGSAKIRQGDDQNGGLNSLFFRIAPARRSAPVSLTWAASKQNSSGGARSVLMIRLEPLPSTADRQYRDIVDSVAFDRRGPGASSSSGLQAARDRYGAEVADWNPENTQEVPLRQLCYPRCSHPILGPITSGRHEGVRGEPLLFRYDSATCLGTDRLSTMGYRRRERLQHSKRPVKNTMA